MQNVEHNKWSGMRRKEVNVKVDVGLLGMPMCECQIAQLPDFVSHADAAFLVLRGILQFSKGVHPMIVPGVGAEAA
jgi:hypothetical protein